MKKNAIIEIKNINKSFVLGERENKVLTNISMEIYQGELITVFGPSGCGKSTLLNTVMGIERPDSGNISVLGMDIWNMNADDRADMRKRSIGVVYQQQNWIKSLSVLENIALSAQLLGYDQEESLNKAKESLALVEMSQFETFYTSELSSGEQQKIGMARALISQPKVIIADEPTGNLDTQSGYEVMDILKNLVGKGITIVLVTHNPEYLKESDRVAIMKNGQIIEVLEKSPNIEKLVTKKIKDSKVERISQVIHKGKIKKEVVNDDIDYPKENVFEKLKINVLLITRFFIETIALLYFRIVSKISPQKAQSSKIKLSKKIGSLENKERISKNINSMDLTEISFKNLFFKKFRTIVTIVGVGLGTGFVVLLLSLGYGVEKIVVDQISAAQDLNQVDVFPKVGSQLLLNDLLVEKIQSITGIDEIYKTKNFPGRVDYEGSTLDVVVYGVEYGYLEQSPFALEAGAYLSEDDESYEAMINKEYLNVLGLKEDIVGDEFNLNVIQSQPSEDTEPQNITIRVIGILDDDASPVVYLNMDAISEYVSEDYSQATIVVNPEASLDYVRKQIESLGLETFSVMDTIDEVESLFQYLRYALLLFGTMAFGIAFLGMINTLMVSLLERTREVGLMKIIGMKRNEIRSVFITESMLIGFLGGIIGLIIGLVLGYGVSWIVYFFSMSRGIEFISISYLPTYLIFVVIISTTVLGFLTGLYPANRAVKIPPLDALRYE